MEFEHSPLWKEVDSGERLPTRRVAKTVITALAKGEEATYANGGTLFRRRALGSHFHEMAKGEYRMVEGKRSHRHRDR